MKRRRVIPSKTKLRTSNNRRRAQKKNNLSIITSRHNVFRLRIVEEMEQAEDANETVSA